MTDKIKVAVVSAHNLENHDYNYDSFYHLVAQSVTEWEEVTEEEYLLLKKYLKNGHFLLKQEDTKMTLEIALEQARKEKEKMEAYKKLEEERKAKQAEIAKKRNLNKIKKLLETNPELRKEIS